MNQNGKYLTIFVSIVVGIPTLFWIAGFTWWNFEWNGKPPKMWGGESDSRGSYIYEKVYLEGTHEVYYVNCHDGFDASINCQLYRHDGRYSSVVGHTSNLYDSNAAQDASKDFYPDGDTFHLNKLYTYYPATKSLIFVGDNVKGF